jgi:hypothetical protein
VSAAIGLRSIHNAIRLAVGRSDIGGILLLWTYVTIVTIDGINDRSGPLCSLSACCGVINVSSLSAAVLHHRIF